MEHLLGWQMERKWEFPKRLNLQRRATGSHCVRQLNPENVLSLQLNLYFCNLTGKASTGHMVFDSIALTALSLALSFGIRDVCQPSIPEPVPIDQFTLTWPHLTQNIKAYQMKKIYPTVTSKKRTILGHEGWESEALNLSSSAVPHAANMRHALQGSRRYRWPAY